MEDWAVNSAGECHLDVVEVRGSNPLPPIPQDSDNESFFFVSIVGSTLKERENHD